MLLQEVKNNYWQDSTMMILMRVPQRFRVQKRKILMVALAKVRALVVARMRKIVMMMMMIILASEKSGGLESGCVEIQV